MKSACNMIEDKFSRLPPGLIIFMLGISLGVLGIFFYGLKILLPLGILFLLMFTLIWAVGIWFMHKGY